MHKDHTHPVITPQLPREEANTTAREHNSPGLEYIDGTEDLPGDLPDPDDGDDSDNGDPPDNPPIDEPPANPHQNENEWFLHVISDLAAGIRTLRQPPSAPRPEKVKVWEPDTFDDSDLCKLRDFLISCNLHFRDRLQAFSSDEKKMVFILSYLKGAAIGWFEPGLMDPTNSTH